MANVLNIKDCNFLYRNFRGIESDNNPAGYRNFCVELDAEFAEVLRRDGWNVKPKKMRNLDDEQKFYIQVSVRFDNFPPDIFMICDGVKNRITEASVGNLDKVDISRMDVSISPSRWERGGRSGIKAYLRKMYVTIEPDDFDDEYRDMPIADDRTYPVEDEEEELPF